MSIFDSKWIVFADADRLGFDKMPPSPGLSEPATARKTNSVESSLTLISYVTASTVTPLGSAMTR